MPRHRLDGPLGDRVGPKLAQLVLSYQLAARKALGPLEAKWHAAGTQGLIDRAGHELADLYRPLTEQLLADHGDQMHPHMRRHFERVGSGAHQWESLAGHLGMQASGALGSVISNYIWPISSRLNQANPNMIPDAQTLGAGYAAGLINQATLMDGGRAWGYQDWASVLWHELALQIPGPEVLWQLVNRGLLTEDEARKWLKRGAVPDELLYGVGQLRRLLLTPADAALGQLRGDLTDAEAVRIAEHQGMTPADFAVMVLNTGEPPGAQQLEEALRRGFIDKQRFATGIRQSRIRDEWLPVLLDLQYSPVATADAIDAALRGWIPEDQARKIAEQNGVMPSEVQILIDNAGNPPSNEQLLELKRRGYIDEQTLERGIRQGRTRDQWIPQIKQLATSPISGADAIDAWLRGHLDDAGLDLRLTDNGLLERDWSIAKANAGNPLALEQLLEAYRRQFIDRARFVQGFRESRYRDEWADLALQLRYRPMSTADAMDALLQQFISEEKARELTEQDGLLPADFDTLRRVTGDPLARTELQQLYNRGLISLEFYKQGLRESRLRDEYVDAAVQLHVREPEAFQVVKWIEYGIVTHDQGLAQLRQLGYTEETARRLVAEGAVTSTGPHRQLMAAEITALFADRIIDRDQAVHLLETIHYTAAETDLMLQLADYKQRQKILNSGIGMIRSHYVAHRIDKTTATADLLALHLPRTAVDLYMQVWDYDRLAHPKQLTEAQIVKAAGKNLLVPQDQLTEAEWAKANQKAGKDRLIALGYDDTDAGLLLAGA